MINAVPIRLEWLSIKSVCEFIDNYDGCNFYYDYEGDIGYCTFSSTASMESFCFDLASLLDLIDNLNSRL